MTRSKQKEEEEEEVAKVQATMEEEQEEKKDEEEQDNDKQAQVQVQVQRVEEAADDDDDDDEEEGEIWDLLECYPPTSKNITCMNETCNQLAIATWVTTNSKNADKWHTCQDCQEEEFGGWPEDFDIPDFASVSMENDSKEEIIKEEEKDDSKQKQEKSHEKKQHSSTSRSTSSEPKEEKKEEEAVPKEDPSLDVTKELELELERDADMTVQKKSEKDKRHCEKDSTSSPTKKIKLDITKVDLKSTNNAEGIHQDEKDSKENQDEDDHKIEENDDKDHDNDNDDEEEDEGDEEDDQWILSKILSLPEITSQEDDANAPSPPICATDDCPLQACSVWVNLSNKNEEPWMSCLDCQELDFDGWPPIEEIPKDRLNMSQDHLEAISERCSRQYKPKLPPQQNEKNHNADNDDDDEKDDDFDPKTTRDNHNSAMSSPISTKKKSITLANNITPPPHSGDLEGDDTKMSSHHLHHKKSMVTPSPKPPSASASVSAAAAVSEKVSKTTQNGGGGSSRPSATALAMHRKWQEAAEKMGGKDARIVVSKPAAKQLILDLLTDGFKPMNITDIYKALKAVVPSPVLKNCLDDMVENPLSNDNPFDDGDDDDDDDSTMKKKKRKTSVSNNMSNDLFAASLLLKVGRNSNSTLYFTNYNLLPNHGNGMDRDERNSFLGEVHAAESEMTTLQKTLQQTKHDTNALLSEPINETLDEKLQNLEEELKQLHNQVEDLRQYDGNQTKRTKVRKQIEKSTNVWRRRRRMTMDFLITMEECTEGTITVKKCLNGDSAIEIDSDEAHIKAALEWAKTKQKRKSSGMMMPVRTLKMRNGAKASLADESFVGVRLDNRGNVERVHLEE